MTEDERKLLSDEDLFRLELLADGELDEEPRRELLARLDQTADGWRHCALAFLEAQCLGESLKKGCLTEEVPADQCPGAGIPYAAEASPFVSRVPQTLTERKRGTSSRLVTFLSSACALLLIGLAGLSFYVARDKLSDSPSAAGRAEIAANAVPSNGTDPFTAVEAAADEEAVGAVRKAAPPDLYAGGGKTYSLKAPKAPNLVGTVPVAAADNKVRHITIRRPGGLDEISVPCVEAESYVSDNSAAEALADNYRAAGCQVDTLHEELKFHLQNGKTVIVPVDTIDVQRAPQSQPVHFL